MIHTRIERKSEQNKGEYKPAQLQGVRVSCTYLLAGEAAEGLEAELGQREDQVLPEHVQHELGHAQVVPAAVHQQQALEEAETADRIVRRVGRLHALRAADADTDVRLRDHIDIVSTVADSKRAAAGHSLADEAHNLRLLVRSRSAGDDSCAVHCDVEEVGSRARLAQRSVQRALVDDQRVRTALVAKQGRRVEQCCGQVIRSRSWDCCGSALPCDSGIGAGSR
jgi:hypothetical protein